MGRALTAIDLVADMNNVEPVSASRPVGMSTASRSAGLACITSSHCCISALPDRPGSSVAPMPSSASMHTSNAGGGSLAIGTPASSARWREAGRSRSRRPFFPIDADAARLQNHRRRCCPARRQSRCSVRAVPAPAPGAPPKDRPAASAYVAPGRLPPAVQCCVLPSRYTRVGSKSWKFSALNNCELLSRFLVQSLTGTTGCSCP
jgi:hypothetical protein